jgi:hypothetical protein
VATPSPGVIVLRQEGYLPIDEGASLLALPEPQRSGLRDELRLDLRNLTERSVRSRDWQEAGREVVGMYRDRIKPLLALHPTYTVAYFGTVPIPLAIQLGFLIGTWHDTTTFLLHHERRDWAWPPPNPSSTLEVDVQGLPHVGSLAEGEIVIRLFTSHAIDPSLTAEVVPRPLAQVDIRTTPLGPDVVCSPDFLINVADRFKQTLDELHLLFPNASAVHLFVAVPVGLAFRLGTLISPTIHPRVHTYEFDAKSNPKYYPSLSLQGEPTPALVVSEEERAAASAERARWSEELQRLQAYVGTRPSSGAGGWLIDVLPPVASSAFVGPWLRLPRMSAVAALASGSVDVKDSSVPGGFCYRPSDRRWLLGDDLLIPIMRRIPDETARRRAARLFLLHEGLHTQQVLTSATSPGIGRFPKVVEDIDYQADVWAQLYERAFSIETDGRLLTDEAGFARLLMSIAVETMLSFDDGPASAEMQVRRVARYLIWSWQYLGTETFGPLDQHVWSLLAEKPSLELAGPSTRVHDDRVWYMLDARFVQAPELAVYFENRLWRFPTGPASPHHEILEGLRTRDAERLRGALRGVSEQARGVR